MVTTADRDYAAVAMQGAAESPAGLGRAIPRLPALARFAPRSLVLDLADLLAKRRLGDAELLRGAREMQFVRGR